MSTLEALATWLRAKCSKSHDLVRLRFAIRIANHNTSDLKGSALRFCCDLKIKGLKSQIARFESAILSLFLQRFLFFGGLRDLKSLAICDLEH